MHGNLTDPEASIGAIFLPRNLSYTESSYLDCYSVSSKFVYNPRVDKQLHYDREIAATEYLLRKIVSISVSMDAETDIDFVPSVCNGVDELNRNQKSDLDDDSELFFVNEMDDLNSLESATENLNLNDGGNDARILSPLSNDLAGTSQGCEGSLGEALVKAMQSREHSNRLKKCSPPSFVFTEVSVMTTQDVNDVDPDLDGEDDTENSLKKDQSFGSQKSLDSRVYEESEFNIDRSELRKSSSLKAKKTPPGTPSRKKMVRFADALGLDLEDVRHVLNAENPPKIPASAMADLKVGIESDRKELGKRFLTPCFQQPGASENFLQRVIAQKVCLENAIITDLTITGVVRVANIGFHKIVRAHFRSKIADHSKNIIGSFSCTSFHGYSSWGFEMFM
ncbi:glycogen-binding subunit 76A-like isoform X3 [Crassostrea angulata]|uniref:glycogen-binding subunit 76A isoform X3 n=1 Tax=Magallana gigas TaxID=29159 RepID=UPI0022B1A941|nr:glycogen-binding subunit 76A-like isoform X3 [Crassostrea angulata]